MLTLIDHRTADGSRHFARLVTVAPWERVRQHVRRLENAELINSVDPPGPRAWLDFSYRGHRFLVHEQGRHVDLLVRNPLCCDLILYQVGSHFLRLSSVANRNRRDNEDDPGQTSPGGRETH